MLFDLGRALVSKTVNRSTSRLSAHDEFSSHATSLLPEAQAGIPIVRATLDSPSAPVRVLFTGDLSRMLGKSVTTIRTFATSSKYSHLIPRPFKLPGSRRLCWYERDVLAWIESTKPAEPPPPRRPRGRPTSRADSPPTLGRDDFHSAKHLSSGS